MITNCHENKVSAKKDKKKNMIWGKKRFAFIFYIGDEI